MPVPASFCCPITQEVMQDPVMALDGHSYEYAAILTWLEANHTSPVTNAHLRSKILVRNFALRSTIWETGCSRTSLAANTLAATPELPPSQRSPSEEDAGESGQGQIQWGGLSRSCGEPIANEEPIVRDGVAQAPRQRSCCCCSWVPTYARKPLVGVLILAAFLLMFAGSWYVVEKPCFQAGYKHMLKCFQGGGSLPGPFTPTPPDWHCVQRGTGNSSHLVDCQGACLAAWCVPAGFPDRFHRVVGLAGALNAIRSQEAGALLVCSFAEMRASAGKLTITARQILSITGNIAAEMDGPRLWARFEVKGTLFLTALTVRDQSVRGSAPGQTDPAAVLVDPGGQLVARQVTFLRLSSQSNGAILINSPSSSQFHNCIFDGNRAATNNCSTIIGGKIYNGDSKTLTVISQEPI